MKSMVETGDIESPLVIFPSRTTEVSRMARELLNGRSLIVNLTGLDSESQLRILDFLSGVSFVLKIKRERLDKAIYLFAVKN